MTSLREELDTLDADTLKHLHDAGFDKDRLLALAATLGDDAGDRDHRNRVAGDVRAPAPDDLLTMPAADSAEHARLRKVGEDAIARGELAFIVLAGGMATRMGGVVKALVEALPERTFLSLRLRENETASARAQRAIPLWLMTSDATDTPIREALAAAKAPAHVRAFMQNLSLRLTPDGRVFKDSQGKTSLHASGHGDLVDAVRRSGYLREFVAGGGKYVWIANLDNLGASIDAAILGKFIEASRDVMVEVCEKAPGDKGGIPVHALGKLQVLEEFRLPKGFDAATVRVFNTNTFLVRAEKLETAHIEWNFFEVEKKVDGAVAIQYERLLQELTSALPSAYLTVPREGPESRFLPVKDHDELARRKDAIRAVALARGML